MLGEGEGQEDATPVAMGPDGKPIRKVNCVKILKRADTEIIKPLLIYNYESISHKKQKEFFDLMMKQGVQFEEAFAAGAIDTDRKSAIINLMMANAAGAQGASGRHPNDHSDVHEGGAAARSHNSYDQ